MSKYVQPHMRKAFETHELSCTCYTEHVKVFRLKRPGTRNMSVQLSFTPEGIHISGDLSLGRDQSGLANVCDRKPLGWFANPGLGKSPSYLCEKFLCQTWQKEVAIEDARSNADSEAESANEEMWDDEDRENYRNKAGAWLAFAQRLERCDEEHDALTCYYEAYDLDEFHSDDFESFGTDYPRTDAGWLCVVQEAFARLYADWKDERHPIDMTIRELGEKFGRVAGTKGEAGIAFVVASGPEADELTQYLERQKT